MQLPLLSDYGAAMELKDRIREARESAGLSKSEVARQLKLSRTAISAWESGGVKDIKNEHLFEFATLTAHNPQWIATGKGPRTPGEALNYPKSPQHPDSEVEFIGVMDAWDSSTPLGPDEVELPLFREVEVAAGSGQTEVVENHGAKLRFAKSTLARAGVDAANAGCATLKGNSMERLIPDGSTIGVDTGSTFIKDGEIYAIDHDGMLRVKYLYRRPGGGLKVVSENSAEHPPEEYTAEQVARDMRIIGRVFWWSVLR